MAFNVGDSVELTVTIMGESEPIVAGTPGIVREVIVSKRTDDGLSPIFPYTVDFNVPDGKDWPIKRDEIKLATFDPAC